MYAESSDTDLEFKNICGVLAITVPSTQMTSVKSITVTSDKQLNGEIESISADGVLTFKTDGVTLTDANKKIKLTFASPVDIASESSKTFYIPVPAGTHKPLRIIVANSSVSKVKETTASGGVSVERSKIYSINFSHNDNNLLTSVFSVSATKTVSFTKGNLRAQYSGGTYVWSFALNQYDYQGDSGTNQGNTTIDSQTAFKYVDLFGWSTDATNNNWGIHTKTANTDGYTTGNFKDWGENFPGKYYSTLSSTEWTYLLSTRTVNESTGEGKSYQRTTLTLLDDTTTVYGVLIVPDNYTGTLSDSTSWSDWQTMASAGVVFLPAAGYRDGSGVFSLGSGGYYWSSTAVDTNNASNMDFNSLFGVTPETTSLFYNGQSVRLVSVASE